MLSAPDSLWLSSVILISKKLLSCTRKVPDHVAQKLPWWVFSPLVCIIHMRSQRHMQKLVERAEQSLEAHSRGVGGVCRQQTDLSEPDALDVLGGRKSLIVSKSNSSSPSSNGMSASPGPTSCKRVSPTTAPAPMPSRAGAVEMLNKYYQEASSDHQKHEHYDYIPPRNFSMTLSTHPQSLPQPRVQPTASHALYPPYSAPSNQNFLSSSNATLQASPISSMPGEVHSDLETSHVYSPTQFWQQPAVSGHYPLQPPHPFSQSDLIMDFSTIPNGNSQFQPVEHRQSYSSEDIVMSQSDIWSNFASDFRP